MENVKILFKTIRQDPNVAVEGANPKITQ